MRVLSSLPLLDRVLHPVMHWFTPEAARLGGTRRVFDRRGCVRRVPIHALRKASGRATRPFYYESTKDEQARVVAEIQSFCRSLRRRTIAATPAERVVV